MKPSTCFSLAALLATGAAITAVEYLPVPNAAAASPAVPAVEVAVRVVKQMTTAEEIKMSNERAKVNGDRAWEALNKFAACSYQAVNNSASDVPSVYPSDDPKIKPLCKEWANRMVGKPIVRLDTSKSPMPMTEQQANFHLGHLPQQNPARVLSASLLKMMPASFELPQSARRSVVFMNRF